MGKVSKAIPELELRGICRCAVLMFKSVTTCPRKKGTNQTLPSQEDFFQFFSGQNKVESAAITMKEKPGGKKRLCFS